MKKRSIAALLALILLLSGCAKKQETNVDILATTAPVAQIVRALTEGTGLECGLLISESVSCLHDYALSVTQMERVETARVVVKSGGGLEDFMADALASCQTVIDASAGLDFLPGEEGPDPHVWLAPENMIEMTKTVAAALGELWPEEADTIGENAAAFAGALADLQAYGEAQLAGLSCRELVTFHDGFAYFAAAFDLTLAASMEIEAGSEPSARELEEIIALVRADGIPAVFTETNGTADAAELVAREVGCAVATLDTAIGTEDYFAAMRGNIDTVKEALG